MKCDTLVKVAEHVRGTKSVDGSHRRLHEALEVADCCRQKGRNDLANELLDQVESFPIEESLLSQVKEQRERIAAGNTSPVVTVAQTAEEHQPEPPPIWIRGLNYSKAMARWVSAGFPMCTQEQIESRLAICQRCPLLANDICTHEKCGCNCNDLNHALNKLAISTESCPEGKWSAVN